MAGQYLKKIIAKSPDDLQFISACCYQAKVKISDIKYLPKNKIFIILLSFCSTKLLPIVSCN